MGYQSIRFYNFRNLADAELELSETVYYLLGPNGAGKSSFLEGLYLLSYGSSFREKQLEHCVRHSGQPFVISGNVLQNGQLHQIQVHCQTSPKKKNISLDGKQLQDRKELLLLAPCIVFAHADIAYIKGSPKEKRQFIDQTISLIDPTYIDLLRNYMRSLSQRNWVLKHKQIAMLPTYTLQMVELGLEVQRRRAQHIAQLSQMFAMLFESVAHLGLELFIEYQPSWQTPSRQNWEQPPMKPTAITGTAAASETVQAVLEYLEQRQPRELLLGASQSGPHRDQLQFTLGDSLHRQDNDGRKREHGQSNRQWQGFPNKDFNKLASTGQLRLAALALKSVQANYLHQSTAQPSVLLLDDVLLEMDDKRRKLFLASLPKYQQVFFTLLPSANYQSYPFVHYKVLRVHNGHLQC